MTRKDYELIAKAIREERRCIQGHPYPPIAKEHLLGGMIKAQVAISVAFGNDNPRFDSGKFHKACEPGE